MQLDIPHMVASALVVMAVIWIVDHSSALKSLPRTRRTIYKFVGVFAAILVLNLVWRPYGGAA